MSNSIRFPKSILWFVLIFLGSYLLFFSLGNSDSIQQKGAGLFIATSGNCIEFLFPKAMIKWNKPGNDPNKVEMRFTDRAEVKRKTREARKNKQFGELRIQSYSFPFLIKEFLWMPLSLLLALILASPQKLKNKGFSLLAGLLLFTFFILFKSSILAYDVFIEYGIYRPSSFLISIINALVGLLRLVGFGLIVTLIIWIVVAFPTNLLTR